MDKSLVLNYVKNDKVFELLEKLSLRGIKSYENREHQRLLEILIVLLNNVDKSYYQTIQQYLFTIIYKSKGDIFADEESIDNFVKIIKSYSDSKYRNISSFIQRFILNIDDNLEGLKDLATSSYLKKSLLSLNIGFLQEIIDSNNASYDDIINIFYSCIDSMEANRRVILSIQAIEIFKDYVIKNPTEYLKHFIRPYYSHGPTKERAEYYLHVGEPFNYQIFGNEFIDFFLNLDQNDNMVLDVLSFYKKNIDHPNKIDKVVMLFSKENKESSNSESFLRLNSSEHVFVRSECKPPNYK